jgi:AcrR family transcriptional regulator
VPLRPPEKELSDWGPEAGSTKTRLRAPALAPGQRRAAIVAATAELLIAHGPSVTTRQIAEAAGIAEGTIFRVFPDKESLIAAAIAQAFDPVPVEAELRAIDWSLPLEERLEAAVTILQTRFVHVWRLMSAVGTTKGHDDPRNGSDPRGASTLRALAAILEPDRARLSRDPLVAAQLLRGLTFAGSHPALLMDDPLSPADIVAVLLDGILTTYGEGTAC